MTEGFTEITSGDTTWRFDRAFMSSNWTCIWGRGCLGILPKAVEDSGHGCCSLGAELDEDEAPGIAALAAMLEPERFQHHDAAIAGGVFSDDTNSATRVIDGACIFLNSAGFEGGAGCALHLAAIDSDDSPLDWKPSVCWQLPIKVDWAPAPDDTEIATVRGWSRADWGADGTTMAWCCTEGDRAYVGDAPVVETLSEELTALVGEAVYVELRSRVTPSTPPK